MEDITLRDNSQLQFNNLYEDTCAIIEQAQNKAIRAVSVALTLRNWQIGQRIAREELDGAARAGYGEQVIQRLSEKLTSKFGKGYDRISLYNYIKFFRLFPEIVDAANQQSEKVDAVSQQLLPWTHYRELIRVENHEARQWYEQEALRETWSTRTLHRNISSQYYFRLLQSQDKQPVINEMRQLTTDFQNDPKEFVKNPIVAEFLGIAQNTSFTETKLETAIIDQLKAAKATDDPTVPDAQRLALMHARWIRMHWGDTYDKDAHLGLAHGYAADQRFTDYYDGACGEGATLFLIEALEANL